MCAGARVCVWTGATFPQTRRKISLPTFTVPLPRVPPSCTPLVSECVAVRSLTIRTFVIGLWIRMELSPELLSHPKPRTRKVPWKLELELDCYLPRDCSPSSFCCLDVGGSAVALCRVPFSIAFLYREKMDDFIVRLRFVPSPSSQVYSRGTDIG